MFWIAYGKKIAKALVEGRSLIISGGNVSFDISKGEIINNKRKKETMR